MPITIDQKKAIIAKLDKNKRYICTYGTCKELMTIDNEAVFGECGTTNSWIHHIMKNDDFNYGNIRGIALATDLFDKNGMNIDGLYDCGLSDDEVKEIMNTN